MVDRLLPALDDDEFARHATAGTRDSSVANIVTTGFDMRTGNQRGGGRPLLCIEGMRLRETATRLPSLLSPLVKAPELRARPPLHSPCHFLPFFFLSLFLLNPADLRLRQIPQRKRAFAPFAVMLHTPKRNAEFRAPAIKGKQVAQEREKAFEFCYVGWLPDLRQDFIRCAR